MGDADRVERAADLRHIAANTLARRDRDHKDRRRLLAAVAEGAHDLLRSLVARLPRQCEVEGEAVRDAAGGSGARHQEHDPGGDDEAPVPQNELRDAREPRIRVRFHLRKILSNATGHVAHATAAPPAWATASSAAMIALANETSERQPSAAT